MILLAKSKSREIHHIQFSFKDKKSIQGNDRGNDHTEQKTVTNLCGKPTVRKFLPAFETNGKQEIQRNELY